MKKQWYNNEQCWTKMKKQWEAMKNRGKQRGKNEKNEK